MPSRGAGAVRRGGGLAFVFAAGALLITGCAANAGPPGPEKSTSTTSPSGTTPPSPTTSTADEQDLVTAVKQAVHRGSAVDSGSGPMLPQLNRVQTDISGKDVQLVFACSGGQTLKLDVGAGDHQIRGQAVCDGNAASVDVPAGQSDEVSFDTEGAPEGAYAYQWYVG